PTLAARAERRRVGLREVTAHIRSVAKPFEFVVVEGAGGLLSPLGGDFASRDLLRALRATPILVCPNRLGAVNQLRLVLAALPRKTASRAQVVVVAPAKPDAASASNAKLVAEFVVHVWLREGPRVGTRLTWMSCLR